MKKSLFALIPLIILLAASSMAHGQFRDQLHSGSDYTGNIVKQRSGQPGDFSNLFNMTMDHSYSMMFSSFGGQMQNMNAYTNTMHFFFSERLTGRVDLSLLHSPFGNSYLNNGGNGANVDFVLRNAELNYKISDKSTISIHFQQVLAYGMGPFGSSPFGYHRDPFNPFNK